MPSFIFLSIGQTTSLTGADYHMHFVKYLTLCRCAADQTTKPGSRITRLLSSSKSSRADYYKFQAAARGRLPRRVRARGPYAVHHARIKQEGSDISKGAAPPLFCIITCKAAAVLFFSPVGGGQIYLKFDFQPNPDFYLCERSERPLGLGCDNVREPKQQ